ncbi:hypothetical protein ACV4W4_37190, partial [Pseudomonas aeruginosa]
GVHQKQVDTMPRAGGIGEVCWPDAYVDTSIELDGEVVDDALVASREVLEVALRDEQHYLRPFDQGAEEEEAIATLYPDGFSAQAFIRVIERNEVWRDLL